MSGAREAWRPVPPEREQVINELTRYAQASRIFTWFRGGIMQIPFYNVFFNWYPPRVIRSPIKNPPFPRKYSAVLLIII